MCYKGSLQKKEIFHFWVKPKIFHGFKSDVLNQEGKKEGMKEGKEGRRRGRRRGSYILCPPKGEAAVRLL